MAGDPKNPVVGEFLFDATEFEAYAVDLPPGGTAGMVTTREDFMLVCMEILTNQPTWGALAGITEQEIEDLAKANARIARIDVFIPALRKALEILTETRYSLTTSASASSSTPPSPSIAAPSESPSSSPSSSAPAPTAPPSPGKP